MGKIYCTECGAELDDSVKFCSSCGIQLDSDKSSGLEVNNNANKDIMERVEILPLGFGLVIILGSLFIGTYYINTTTVWYLRFIPIWGLIIGSFVMGYLTRESFLFVIGYAILMAIIFLLGFIYLNPYSQYVSSIIEGEFPLHLCLILVFSFIGNLIHVKIKS